MSSIFRTYIIIYSQLEVQAVSIQPCQRRMQYCTAEDLSNLCSCRLLLHNLHSTLSPKHGFPSQTLGSSSPILSTVPFQLQPPTASLKSTKDTKFLPY